MDKILKSIFLDNALWVEVIEHGLSKGISNELLEDIQDPHFRADLCMQIGSGKYFIKPPHTGYRPKEDGGERTFFANEPLDRLLLNVIYKWLMRNTKEMIHPTCLSYQEGIGVGTIVRNLSKRIAGINKKNSNKIVGRKFDIHKYFETIERRHIHSALDKVEEKFGKSTIINLLRDYYDSDIYYDSRRKEYVEAYQGIKQGCAVSSWLANVILYKLDKEVSELGGEYVRYSDDIIYVGENYEKATDIIVSNLKEVGLSLNERKIENIVGNEFIRFLGYNIRGGEITLSAKWVKYFKQNIDRLTIKDKKLITRVRNIRKEPNSEKREAKLRDILEISQRRVARFLYLGDGEYSWATLVLGIINRPEDIKTLNLYCIDALRAVYTGKTNIGGLGVSKSKGILRSLGRNVAENRRKTIDITGKYTALDGWLDNYYSIAAMKKSINNKWLYRTITCDLVTSDYENITYKYNGSDVSLEEYELHSNIEELEKAYKQYLNSRPDGKKVCRYYAKSISNMNTIELLRGKARKAAMEEFEDYINKNIDYNLLKRKDKHWYWQSSTFPQLILLKKWFK